jgi:hypothetical protein
LFQIGESVEIQYLRGNEKRKTSILLEEKPRKKKFY